MDLKTLTELIAGGESDRLEFKRSTANLREGVKTACAMLNGRAPGFVLFGVNDRGEVVGQHVTTRTLEEVANQLRCIEPPAMDDIGVESVALDGDKAVLVLRIDGNGRGPYVYDGRPYHRHGPTTGVMPLSIYNERLLERYHATHRWELEPAIGGFGLADLDEDEIQRTVDNAVRLGRLEPPRDRSPEAILRGLNLIAGDRLLNAAVALYGTGSRLQIHYPQISIRLARFRGTNRLADFADNRQYVDHAFGMLRRAESFLLDHVPIAGRVVPGQMIREDRPLYPPRATREALANAICHRDYAEWGGAVTLAMYDDHLEIGNPGALRFGLTPEKLFQPHESLPWNPLIAGVFYRAGIIEKWGTGTLNILDWCHENASPPPTYEEQTGAVHMIFFPAAPFDAPDRATEPPVPETTQVSAQVSAQVTAQVIDRILLYCEQPRRASEIQAMLGLRHRQSFQMHYLRPLLADGYLAMTVPDKPRSRLQRYQLTDRGRAWLDGREKADAPGKRDAPAGAR